MVKGKLLIVDDDADLAAILARRFRYQGYHVALGSDGDEALHLFRRERPDLLLMDVQMPRLDGVVVFREIREIDPSAAVIIMSGHVNSAQARMMLDDGACDFIVKPFDLKYLDISVSTQMLLRQILRAGGGRGAKVAAGAMRGR